MVNDPASYAYLFLFLWNHTLSSWFSVSLYLLLLQSRVLVSTHLKKSKALVLQFLNKTQTWDGVSGLSTSLLSFPCFWDLLPFLCDLLFPFTCYNLIRTHHKNLLAYSQIVKCPKEKTWDGVSGSSSSSSVLSFSSFINFSERACFWNESK